MGTAGSTEEEKTSEDVAAAVGQAAEPGGDSGSSSVCPAAKRPGSGDFRTLPPDGWAALHRRFRYEVQVQLPQSAAAASVPVDLPCEHRPSRLGNYEYRNFLHESKGSVFDFYEKLGDLGEGAFGDVWLGRERIRAGAADEHSGRQVAIKRVRKPNSLLGLDEDGADSAAAIVDFRMEVELMKALDHPGCCRLLEVFEDPKSIFLVMEFIKGGELFHRISEFGSFSEHDAATVVRQVASALSYCHSHGVVHRDIKPENILVVDLEDDDDLPLTVKVIDFGFGCRILRGAKLKAKVGTFLYTAPEALKDEPCDEGIDMWALGCVLFALLSGNSPFYGPNCRDSIVKGEYTMDGPDWQDVSDNAKDLIRGLLVVDPARRLTASQVHLHPWVSEHTDSTPHRSCLRGVVNSLRDFHCQSRLRHLCSGVLARQLDETRLHELHETFSDLDTDDDGILTMAELKTVWEGLGLGENDQIWQMFADIDMDASGSIDYTEFIAACLDQRTKHQEEACWAAFRIFDDNGDGRISYEELLSVVTCSQLHDSISKDTLNGLWYELTGVEVSEGVPDHLDGDVDFDHFLAALGNAEAKAAAKAKKRGPAASAGGDEAGEGVASAPQPVVKSVPSGLPIAARPRGAITCGLPIAGRRRAEAATSSVAAAGPAAGPDDDEAPMTAAATLPVPSRRGAGGGLGGLPIKQRGGGYPAGA